MDIGCRRCDVLKHKMNDSICDFTSVLLHCSASTAREYLQRMMGDLESGKGEYANKCSTYPLIGINTRYIITRGS